MSQCPTAVTGGVVMAAAGTQRISWQRDLSSPHKHVGIIAPVTDVSPPPPAHRPQAPQPIGLRGEGSNKQTTTTNNLLATNTTTSTAHSTATMAATGTQKISWQRDLSSPHKHVGIIAPDVSSAPHAASIAHRPHAPQAIGHRSEFLATTCSYAAAQGTDDRLEYPEPRKAREVERQIRERLERAQNADTDHSSWYATRTGNKTGLSTSASLGAPAHRRTSVTSTSFPPVAASPPKPLNFGDPARRHRPHGAKGIHGETVGSIPSNSVGDDIADSSDAS